MSRERGSGTVLVLMIGLLLTAVVGVCLAFTGLLAVRHRVEQAADLAALAAASTLSNGGDQTSACAAAARIAEHNRAQLSKCSVHGRDVDVVTAADVPGWVTTMIQGEASAGPR